MPAMMFYEKVATLDRLRHRDLRIRPLADQRFAARTAAIPVVVGEFVDVAREYPIVFARDTRGGISCVCLTGVREDHNLYLDAAGHWDARYVPAFIRRYPFVFGENGTDRFFLCIDEACPAFGSEGDALFDDQGEPSAALQNVLKLLNEYQRQVAMTQAFLAKLQGADLLRERQMRANMPDGRAAAIDGFLVVDEERLRALPEATLKQWLEGGELALVYAHLFSLGNFIELARRQPPRA